jgi:hypothetical protein
MLGWRAGQHPIPHPEHDPYPSLPLHHSMARPVDVGVAQASLAPPGTEGPELAVQGHALQPGGPSQSPEPGDRGEEVGSGDSPAAAPSWRRRQQQERNRRAAQKYRREKRARSQEMQERLCTLERENEELRILLARMT